MADKLRILIVEDVPTDAELMERAMRDAKIEFASKVVMNESQLRTELQEFTPEIILSDFFLPELDGLRVLKIAGEHSPDVPVIIVTGSINEETAVGCMKAGAEDYVLKHHLLRIAPAVQSALEKKRIQEEKRRALADLHHSERRYFSLFEESPTPLWEEDLSQVIEYLNQLRDSGISDLGSFFLDHPEAVHECVSNIEVVDVNQATVELFRAGSKRQLLANLNQVFTEEAYGVFSEQMCLIAEGKKNIEVETTNRTLTGEELHVMMRWVVPGGDHKDFSRVYISTIDITERKASEKALAEANEALERDRRSLEQKNIAMREVLDQIEMERTRTAQQLQANVDRVVLPILSKLEGRLDPGNLKFTGLLRSGLEQITSPFVSRLESQFAKLTPREVEICNMIKNGLSSKEISQTLDTSPETVRSQRKSIRKKLGIDNEDVNLSSYLRTIE